MIEWRKLAASNLLTHFTEILFAPLLVLKMSSSSSSQQFIPAILLSEHRLRRPIVDRWSIHICPPAIKFNHNKWILLKFTRFSKLRIELFQFYFLTHFVDYVVHSHKDLMACHWGILVATCFSAICHRRVWGTLLHKEEAHPLKVLSILVSS